jgi:hypothetical protein
MKIDKMFLVLLLSMVVILTYGCEKSKDTEAQKSKDTEVQKEEIQVPKTELKKIKSVTGSWDLTSSDGDSGLLILRQSGNDIIGTFKGTNNPNTLYTISGSLKDEEITLEFSEGNAIIAKYEGQVVAEKKISGKWTSEGKSGTWEATK